jgi:ABC-type uncharacterized transport system permease subunit
MVLTLPWTFGLVAMLAYTAATWPKPVRSRWPEAALAIGWAAHAGTLVLDVVGWGSPQTGARFGFAPALSATVWLVLAVHSVESRFVPLPGVRRALALAGAVVVVLATALPGTARPQAGSAWLPLHWLFGLVSYGLFAMAVLHAWMLDTTERRLRGGAGLGTGGGMPLLWLERVTFRFVEVGFAVLSAALLLGWLLTDGWRWGHKNVLSLLAWATFAVLIGGRHWRGWRGRHATRWIYAGALMLLLAYAGARFVLEVVLRRPA